MMCFSNHYLAKLFIADAEDFIEEDFTFMFPIGMKIKYYEEYYIIRDIISDLTPGKEAIEYYLEKKE